MRMLLQIYNLDGEADEAPVCTLSFGEHIIGRGDLLKCHDQRASRSHATIKVDDNTVTITSTHQNPCFYQSAGSTTVVILTQDSPTEIKDGDKFGIFPDQFWFKTKFVFDTELLHQPRSLTEPLLTDNDLISASKRQAEGDSNESSQSKIAKLENGTLKVISDSNNENASPPNQESHDEKHEVINGNIKEVLSASDDESKAAEDCEEKSPIEDVQISGNDVNTVNSEGEPIVEMEKTIKTTSNNANTDEQVASSSGTTGNNQDEGDSYEKPRDRCWYGENCYRKSAHHKKEFSHRGDPDYDSDPNDFRPICYYGTKCYRKNKEHFKQFKHSRTTRKPPKRRERRKKKDPKKGKATASGSSEDDYDYDDPFLNDNSEDDYEEESWSEDDSDDEDWTESADEDTGSLMKEAKRFMKQKKK